MPEKDFFAGIASEHHTTGKEELVRPEPVKYDKKLFKPSTLDCGRIMEISLEEMLVEFKEELARLKKKYKPFMSCLLPKASTSRKSTELRKFNFRYAHAEDNDISHTLNGCGDWEKVTIPDYRGPVGKWTGYYRTVFSYGKVSSGKKVFLRFLGVDYIADVYLNNRHVGSHEGFFAPFEFDVTAFLKYNADNVLLVEIRNDVPTIGLDNEKLDGDKIYAATGLGWDDPREGWHHCPPGAGVYNKVLLEERSEIFIDSVFIRPDIDNSAIEAHIQVYNTFNIYKDIKLSISINPYNFEGEGSGDIAIEGIESAGPGINYYQLSCSLPGFRLWKPDEPWLYAARITLRDGGEASLDQRDSVFGMRKFHMDVEGEEKGTLYLNNKPVILRGANDMGHMQQCVLKEDFDQLVEDILIAKLANMNYYRFTQRPVHEEIYHYCDMLGMMNQTDLPLFGYLRRNQFCEALRQVGEMERLVRNHPSAIMISYINEAMHVSRHNYGQRHLYRNELEAFFGAADKVIMVENPDRVVKHVEGDYDPPTFAGLSDFHCYNLWYINHALPFGELYKGRLPAIKKGWKTGCGEYGAEGLDNYDVMMKYYPKEWLPSDDCEEWIPDRIVLSQTNDMHGVWYEDQHNIKDWIKESQKHQAFATKILTDALRRRSDRVVSTALHLLIDAWPSGWMKTLVGVDRIPKPSYFAFRKSLEPVRVNLRCDRWKVYEGDEIEVEAWLLNDTHNEITGSRIIATLRDDAAEYGSYSVSCSAKPASSQYAGSVRVRVPETNGRSMYYVDAALLDENGRVLNMERFSLEAFERPEKNKRKTVAYIGDKAYGAAFALGMRTVEYCRNAGDFDVLAVSDYEKYLQYRDAVEDAVKGGAHVIFMIPENGSREWDFGGKSFIYRNILGWGNDDDGSGQNGIFFIARNSKDEKTKEFRPDDFSCWYNAGRDMIDFTAVQYVDSDEVIPLLFECTRGTNKHRPVAGVYFYGKGRATFLSICLDGRVGYNPVLDRFINNLLEMEADSFVWKQQERE